jgi:hypothetical protein
MQDTHTDYLIPPDCDSPSALNWENLEKALLRTRLSPLDAWKEQYEDWKQLYGSFRAAEEQSFYSADASGKAVSPTVQEIRAHRQCITLLLHTGQQCLETLLKLPLDEEESKERHDWHLRMETLLISLREAMEIWHPANKQPVAKLKEIFHKQAA